MRPLTEQDIRSSFINCSKGATAATRPQAAAAGTPVTTGAVSELRRPMRGARD